MMFSYFYRTVIQKNRESLTENLIARNEEVVNIYYGGIVVNYTPIIGTLHVVKSVGGYKLTSVERFKPCRGIKII